MNVQRGVTNERCQEWTGESVQGDLSGGEVDDCPLRRSGSVSDIEERGVARKETN